jgi:hypothetical protein
VLSVLTIQLLGMNTQALGFFASNMMAFLENASLALASLQPWREFPPGHPRHGKYLTAEPFTQYISS